MLKKSIYSNYFIKIIFLFTLIVLPSVLFAASASIQYFSPSTIVSVGGDVFFRISPEGFSGAITYIVSDTFSGTSVSSSNIDSSGTFIWKPATQDIGTHNITVNLSDQFSNTASVSQQIIVPVIPTVTIRNVFPSSSVNVGQTIFFSTLVTGFTNPIYSITDSIYTSSLTPTNMNSSGDFSWTPKSWDVGSHNITIVVTDNSGRSATAIQSIIVGVATTTIELLSPGNTVTSRQNVTFKVTPINFTNPIYTLSDSVSGSSINSGNLNALGIFNWTPTPSDLGTHLITIRVSDASGSISTISQQITVTNPRIDIKSASPSTTIGVGVTLSFNATSTGLITPRYTINDSFGGTSISNSNINSSGEFSWTPKSIDIGVHPIRILATDNFGSNASTEMLIIVKASSSATISSPTNAGVVTVNTPTTAVNYTFNKSLSVGSSGADVSALQVILKQQGFLSTDVTGYYGSLTEKAVKDFQSSRGLEAVGFVGPGTRTSLNNLQNINTNAGTNTTTNTTANSKYTFTKPLTIGSTGTEVSELQKKLTSLGLYSGPITGTFGPLTQTAVKKLQLGHNLEQIGSVGPATRTALNSEI
ncbi:MAG: peptidoglycan-binding protein [Candidatus Zambryskibacteria bacterium]|nr:peptidoglycan-binding protein [Candidatus Zambryskibacteria bacterium]